MLFMRTQLMKLVWILLVVGLYFSFSHVSASAPDSDLIDKLQKTSTVSPKSLKNLIDTYCSTVLSD